jgi:dTDP-4-dehydrorhamnose reductase
MTSAQAPILICGGTGLLGPYLATAAQRLGPVVSCGRTSGDVKCDLTEPAAVARMLGEVRPSAVFHCVALTDVDACERQPAAADALNRGSVANVVAELSPEARLVFFSTDQVYPGEAGPYPEAAEAPINVYGSTKLVGERAALEHANALVLRVNFFGPSKTRGRQSLSDWMISSLRRGEAMTLFSDSLFSPLHLSTLAGLTVDAVSRGLQGVFNLGSRGGMSKLDFGLEIARRLACSVDNIAAGTMSALPGRAPRPRDMRMSVDKIERALGRTMPTLPGEIALLETEPGSVVQ